MTHSQLLPAKCRRQSTPLPVNSAEDFPAGFNSASHRAISLRCGLPSSDKPSETVTESDRSVFDSEPEEQAECALNKFEKVLGEHARRPQDEFEAVPSSVVVTWASRVRMDASFLLASSKESISLICESKSRC